MKGLACAECVCIRTLLRGNLTPVSCECGNVTGWWIDGSQGIARYHAQRSMSMAYGVGLNNHFLIAALTPLNQPQTDEAWRELHRLQGHAPGFLFDASRRDCWVILFKPGTVRDVEWATHVELDAIGYPTENRGPWVREAG